MAVCLPDCSQLAQASPLRCHVMISTMNCESLSHDEDHFAVFVCNENDERWNQFVEGLCSLYFACSNDEHRARSGMIYAQEFVESYYSQFLVNWAQHKRQFHSQKKKIVERVANQLMTQEYMEFEIGNVVEH